MKKEDKAKVIEQLKELLGDIISLLESPIMDVISQASSAGNTIHGVLETLEKRAEA